MKALGIEKHKVTREAKMRVDAVLDIHLVNMFIGKKHTLVPEFIAEQISSIITSEIGLAHTPFSPCPFSGG